MTLANLTDGFYLVYDDSAFTLPRCWHIGATLEAANAEYPSLLEQHDKPERILAVRIEEWKNKVLVSTTQLPVRKEL